MTGGERVRLRATADGDAQLTPIYQRVERAVRSVPTMYQALANSPEILKAWIGLGWSLRAEAGSDRGLHELAILRVAQLTGSEYVWRSHWRPALDAGVSEPKLRALTHWRDSDLYTKLERAVLALTDSLTETAKADDTVWGPVAALLDDRQAVELVMTVSWYCCVARVAAGLAVPLESYHARVPGLGAAS